jgi:hypothetical protein
MLCDCRFVQGLQNDQSTVDKIRELIREQKEVSVQLIYYNMSGNFASSGHILILLVLGNQS